MFKKTVTNSASFQTRAEKVLTVFQSSVAQLEAIASEADNQKKVVEDQIATLKSEADSLDTVSSKYRGIASKWKEALGL